MRVKRSARTLRKVTVFSCGNSVGAWSSCDSGKVERVAIDAIGRTLCARSLNGENAAMNSAARKTLISLSALFSICPAWGGIDEGITALVSKDYAKAIAEFRPMAIKGDAGAQRLLGGMYRRGRGVTRDPKQAAGWYLKAAEQGDALAQYALGEMYEAGEGLPQDEWAAADWYRRAAEQGNAKAQISFGAMHESGRGGVPKDYTQAVVWYRKAADQGNAIAQFNLGVMCQEGRGLPKDDTEAAVWFRKSAEQGNPFAQNNLGAMYSTGRGVPKDESAAVAWYRRAAEQGEVNAQFSLGSMYSYGRGVEKDDQQALVWFRKVAEQGYADGQFALGVMYDTGRGVPKDDQRAYLWYLLAAARGNVHAQNNRDIVGAALTPEQRAEAQASARTWRPVAGGSGGQRTTGQPPDSSQGSDPESHPAADATGSGFRVGSDLIVTNQHVVQDCQRVGVGGAGTARVVANDARNDLALLSTGARASAAATIRAGRQQIGEQVLVAGYPLRGLLSGLNVTAGNLSSLVGMGGDTRFVQISAPVQPGNSGGPLLDASGNVIGVVVSKLNAVKVAKITGDIPQNVNFAITANVLRAFLEASGVEYKSGSAGSAISTTEVARKAQAITVLIECWK